MKGSASLMTIGSGTGLPPPESRLRNHSGYITLEAKSAGARSAGNLHAACEEAGAGTRR